MSLIHKLSQWFLGLCGYARLSIRLGFSLLCCFYITAGFAYLLAPHVPNYFRAMAVFRGSLEAAPASFVAGFCAGLICDVAYKTHASRK